MTVKKSSAKPTPGREVLKGIIDRDKDRRDSLNGAIRAILNGKKPFDEKAVKAGRGGFRVGAGRKPTAPARSVKIAEELVLAASEKVKGTSHSIRDQIEEWIRDGMRIERDVVKRLTDEILHGKPATSIKSKRKKT